MLCFVTNHILNMYPHKYMSARYLCARELGSEFKFQNINLLLQTNVESIYL